MNEKGTLLVSVGNENDIVVWNADWASKNCYKSLMTEEHENVIDVVQFAHHEAARVLTKMIMTKKGNEQG